MLGSERIARLNAMAVGDTMPDITVYLRMPPDIALSRRLGASLPDRIEQENESFFERTYRAFEELYRQEGMTRAAIVDASQSIEDVTKAMLSAVDEKLNKLSV